MPTRFEVSVTSRLVVVLAFGLVATTARASTSFPPAIQSEWELDDPPACVLCHQTELGGLRTVVTPFGREMMDLGVVGGLPASLVGALQTARAEALDSDRDCVSDYDELQAGEDPNVSTLPDAPPPLPTMQTGCAFDPRASAEFVGIPWILSMIALGFALRRRALRGSWYRP